MAVREDDQLMSWDEVQNFLPPNLDPNTRGILLGNGASMAIWKRFHYSTLYEIACDTNRHPHLETSDQEVFGHLDTVNFEAVLSALITAGKVWAAFRKPSHDIDDIRRSYLRIKNVLIAAVRSVHAPYEKFGQDIKRLMSNALKEYGYVYTTNYDLLLYWSIMDQPGEFKDFFWNVDRENNRVWFDLGDTDEWKDNVTKVLYLHGSLHLCKHPEGTFKRMSSESGNILEQFDVQRRNLRRKRR